MAVRGVEQPLFLGYEPSVIIPFHSTATKCGLYSFFTSRSSFNDNFCRNYQTHFQPFLDDFHVGKTTHQACFVFGKERLELSILSATDFESVVYANSTTYRYHLLVDLNHCRWDENPLS